MEVCPLPNKSLCYEALTPFLAVASCSEPATPRSSRVNRHTSYTNSWKRPHGVDAGTCRTREPGVPACIGQQHCSSLGCWHVIQGDLIHPWLSLQSDLEGREILVFSVTPHICVQQQKSHLALDARNGKLRITTSHNFICCVDRNFRLMIASHKP